LRLQKSGHVAFCIRAVPYQIDMIILPIPLIEAFYARAGKAAAFEAPLEASLKSTSFFDAIPATLPGDFLVRRPAAGAWLFAGQMCAARKAVYAAWRNHSRFHLSRHFHKASPP